MSSVPPPTRGAENAKDGGTAVAGCDLAAGADRSASGLAGCTSGLPHAANAATPTRQSNNRRTGGTLTALAWQVHAHEDAAVARRRMWVGDPSRGRHPVASGRRSGT